MAIWTASLTIAVMLALAVQVHAGQPLATDDADPVLSRRTDVSNP